MNLGKWIQPLRVKYFGDVARGQDYLGVARQEVATVESLMKFQNLQQLVRRVRVEDVIVEAGIILGMPFANIHVPVYAEAIDVAFTSGEGEGPGRPGDPAGGGLYTWGNNMYGQLGTGDTEAKLEPYLIDQENVYIQVVGGFTHTLALREDGSLWSFGYNVYGQLGLGHNDNALEMQRVGSEEDVWIKIAAGDHHSLGIKSDNTLWAWGRNQYCALGLGPRWVGDTVGDQLDRNVPTQVYAPSSNPSNEWSDCAAGDYHSVAIGKYNARMYAVGRNQFGQLGQRVHSSFGADSLRTTFSVCLGSVSDDSTDDIFDVCEAGVGFTMGIRRFDHTVTTRNWDGAPRLCGYNSYYELGSSAYSLSNYLRTPAGLKFGKFALAGRNHVLCFRQDVDGDITSGVLQHNIAYRIKTYEAGDDFTNAGATENATGHVFFASGFPTVTPAVWSNGSILESIPSQTVWGRDGNGQLGLGSTDTRRIATHQWTNDWIATASKSVGGFHSLAIMRNRDDDPPAEDEMEAGDLYVWGGNGQGELGTGDTADVLTPTLLEFPSVKWTCVAAGRYHSAGYASR